MVQSELLVQQLLVQQQKKQLPNSLQNTLLQNKLRMMQLSYSGMINANQKSFGNAVVPHYRFDKADVIVSFGADFSW